MYEIRNEAVTDTVDRWRKYDAYAVMKKIDSSFLTGNFDGEGNGFDEMVLLLIERYKHFGYVYRDVIMVECSVRLSLTKFSCIYLSLNPSIVLRYCNQTRFEVSMIVYRDRI